MNPLYRAIGNSTQNNQFANMVQQFQQFKQSFTGNPKEEVMRMLQSGKISQQQLNEVQAMATQFQQLLK